MKRIDLQPSVAQLIRKLRSPDNGVVLQAVDELRVRGHLANGSLEWVFLRYVNMQGANLCRANLCRADLTSAKLNGCDLREAYLQGTRLNRADLQGARLSGANLRGAFMTKTNLLGVHGATEGQLAQASRMRGATMPDGSRYNGRFNLAGDLADVAFLRLDTADNAAMATFYGASLRAYRDGQAWFHAHLASGLTAIQRDDPKDEIDWESLFDFEAPWAEEHLD